MNTSASHTWSQPEQLDHMAGMANELGNMDDLFEFGDMNSLNLENITNVDPSSYDEQIQQAAQQLSHPTTPFNEISQAAPPVGTSTQDFGGPGQYGMTQGIEQQPHFMAQPRTQPPTSHPFTAEGMYQPQYHPVGHPQQYHFSQHTGYPPGHVPPTPNSFEMHGEAGRFLQQQQLDPQQRALMDQRYQLRKDDAIAFTPMVSPAGTPQYNVPPEFTIPGAYFSPLTSPMLDATRQNHLHQHGYYTNPSTAQSSNATSPVDPNVDVDMVGDSMSLPEPATTHGRKPKRKVAAPRSVAAGAKVRQSPIQKPQKRKSGMLSSVVPSKSNEQLMVDAQQRPSKVEPGSAGLQTPAVFTGSSEDGSISPEHLSEALMGPPPRPGSSLTQSPAISAHQQQDQHDGTSTVGKVATPNSLFSQSGNQQPIDGSAHRQAEDGALEDLQLPEAASRHLSQRPSLTQLNTQLPSSASTEQTPRMTARKTPKLGPLSTPSSARPMSAVASPSILGSPMTASTPGALLKDKRSDSKGARGNKKRASIGTTSAMVSPALRPRISPSIKPLLPEGSLHSPTHALLLASKSNYQNLLEGNHLPGVNYPDSLSTGLTSKRTSHKVAEQGRRNRINEALKEMQALVPMQSMKKVKGEINSDESPEAGGGADVDSKESKEEGTAKSNNSKAATVECANVYIRDMQRREREKDAEIARLRQLNEEISKRLGEHNGAASSTESADTVFDSASPASVKVKSSSSD